METDNLDGEQKKQTKKNASLLINLVYNGDEKADGNGAILSVWLDCQSAFIFLTEF